MFVRSIIYLFVCAIIGLFEAAIVDTIKRCSVQDEECLKTSFGEVFKKISVSGIPEYGLPIFDPLEIKNESISWPNFMNLKLIDGRAIGIGNCNIDRIAVLLDKGQGILEFSCDLLIVESTYELTASSPILLSILGSESIHGEGNGKVELENLHLKVDAPIKIQKREEELYLIYDRNHITYEYEVLGKATMFADSIYIGEQESSKDALKLLNNNWKLVMSTFGNPIVGKTTKMAFDIFYKFYNFVPARYYLTGDFSPYV